MPHSLSWSGQYCLLVQRNFRRAKRDRHAVTFFHLWPLTIFGAFVLVVPLSFRSEWRPACYTRPLALPSAGTLPYVQSVACGLGVLCVDREWSDPYRFVRDAPLALAFGRSLETLDNRTAVDALVRVGKNAVQLVSKSIERYYSGAGGRWLATMLDENDLGEWLSGMSDAGFFWM